MVVGCHCFFYVVHLDALQLVTIVLYIYTVKHLKTVDSVPKLTPKLDTVWKSKVVATLGCTSSFTTVIASATSPLALLAACACSRHRTTGRSLPPFPSPTSVLLMFTLHVYNYHSRAWVTVQIIKPSGGL